MTPDELERCDCRGCELRRRNPPRLTKRDLAFLAGDQPNNTSAQLELPRNRVLARLRRMGRAKS